MSNLFCWVMKYEYLATGLSVKQFTNTEYYQIKTFIEKRLLKIFF